MDRCIYYKHCISYKKDKCHKCANRKYFSKRDYFKEKDDKAKDNVQLRLEVKSFEREST